MLLADCVTIFNNDEIPSQEKKDLTIYIKSLSEVVEVRAVAFHDITSTASP